MNDDRPIPSDDICGSDFAPDIALLMSQAKDAEARYKREIYDQHGAFFDFHQDVGCKHFGKTNCGYWMQ